MLRPIAPSFPKPRSTKRKSGEEGGRGIGVVIKILLLIKRSLFSTCAKELRKAEKLLRGQVKVRRCGQYHKGRTIGQEQKLSQLRADEKCQSEDLVSSALDVYGPLSKVNIGTTTQGM